MKRVIPFVLSVVILMLCSFSASTAGSTKLTASVPTEHTVTVICSREGGFRVLGTNYVDTRSFKVKRFESIAIEALPGKNLSAEFITDRGVDNIVQGGNGIRFDKVNRDFTVKITFVNSDEKQTRYITGLPEDCAIAAGSNKWFTVNVAEGVNLTYLWERSCDGGITWHSAEGDNDKQKYYLVLAKENSYNPDLPYQYRVTVTDENGFCETDIIKVLVTDRYIYRKLVNSDDCLALSSYLHSNTELIVTRLDSTNEEAVRIASNLSDDKVPLLIYEVSLVNAKGEAVPYFGDLDLEFEVGDAYNGMTLRVFHLHDDGMKIHMGEVENGILKIKVDNLSTFMIEAPRESVCSIFALSNIFGSISPAGKVFVGTGDSITFKFNPDFGYVVDSVIVNGKLVPVKGNCYTLSSVYSNSSISVSFRKCTSCIAIWMVLLVLIFLLLTFVIVKKNQWFGKRTIREQAENNQQRDS